LSYDHHRGFKF